ncbi:unnamed protein product [Sphenostylis stenocarpa]|uniref:Uncharacterized protein n=1 Tax=Sphenostylis stenocarpa TaxID=92480 RepID=A0AA86V8J5_9FABA|nr:unnamed protein product [Sphenostylis stenocarpa]
MEKIVTVKKLKCAKLKNKNDKYCQDQGIKLQKNSSAMKIGVDEIEIWHSNKEACEQKKTASNRMIKHDGSTVSIVSGKLAQNIHSYNCVILVAQQANPKRKLYIRENEGEPTDNEVESGLVPINQSIEEA